MSTHQDLILLGRLLVIIPDCLQSLIRNREIKDQFAVFIYTFDDEIINEYYLTPDYPFCSDDEYEYALKNGTYETHTTDWIDVNLPHRVAVS